LVNGEPFPGTFGLTVEPAGTVEEFEDEELDEVELVVDAFPEDVEVVVSAEGLLDEVVDDELDGPTTDSAAWD
jgi:hypothetical protein